MNEGSGKRLAKGCRCISSRMAPYLSLGALKFQCNRLRIGIFRIGTCSRDIDGVFTDSQTSKNHTVGLRLSAHFLAVSILIVVRITGSILHLRPGDGYTAVGRTCRRYRLSQRSLGGGSSGKGGDR